MAVWVVRASPLTRSRERKNYEELALDQGLAVLGWEALSDLSSLESRQQLHDLYLRTYREDNAVTTKVRQIWDFRASIQAGDYIVLPFQRPRFREFIAVGTVIGPYKYRPDLGEEAKHTRGVRWLDKNVFRGNLTAELRKVLNLRQVVYQIEGNPAAEIRAIISKGHQPSGEAAPLEETHVPSGQQDGEPEAETNLSQEEPREDESDRVSFRLEHQLRDFIVQNLKTIRVNRRRLRLYTDEKGRSGVEYPIRVGRIDILAVDEDGAFVIFELKLSRGSDATLGQLQRYMGCVKKDLAKGSKVTGVIVAEAFDDKLRMAASVTTGITLFTYAMTFTITEVDLE